MEIEAYRPRPIGSNWLSCFVCEEKKDGVADIDDKGNPIGEVVQSKLDEDGVHYGGGYHSCQPDMSAYVDNKESGEHVVKMFEVEGCRVFLDFRPSEPNHVQVKAGACEKHLPNLEELQRLTFQHKVITREIIREAKEYKP